LSVRAMPVIVPVRYAVAGETLRVWPDTRAPGGSGVGFEGSIVAFQADGLDEEVGRGWSVHVVGRVEAVAPSDRDDPGGGLAIRPVVVDGAWVSSDEDR